MGITGEKRERETGEGQKRRSEGGQQNKARQLKRRSARSPSHLEAYACSDSILSPSELQNGAINGETVLGPTALIVNRRQGAEGAYGGLPLDLSPPFVDRRLPGDLSGMTVGRVFKVRSVCVFRSRRG